MNYLKLTATAGTAKIQITEAKSFKTLVPEDYSIDDNSDSQTELCQAYKLGETIAANATIYNLNKQLSLADSKVQNLTQRFDSLDASCKLLEQELKSNVSGLTSQLTALTETNSNLNSSFVNCSLTKTECIRTRNLCSNSLKGCQKNYNDKIAQWRNVLAERNHYLNHSLYLNHTAEQLAVANQQLEKEQLANQNLTAHLKACEHRKPLFCKCESGALLDKITTVQENLSKLAGTTQTLPTTPMTPTTTETTTTTTESTATRENLLLVGTTQSPDSSYYSSDDYPDYSFNKTSSDCDVPTTKACLLAATLRNFFYLALVFLVLSLTIIWLFICGCQQRSKNSELRISRNTLNSAREHIVRLNREVKALNEKVAQLQHVIDFESNRRSQRAATETTIQVS